MKIKILTSIFIISVLNILAGFLIKDKMYFIFTCFIGTSIGVILLYKWMLSPINQMAKRLTQIEEENCRVENMRKEFVANVSHELRTPLTSISGFIETLQAGAAEDPEARNRFIEIIAIETARLKRLIQDILVLSDIESKIEINDCEFSSREVVYSVVELLEPIASSKEISMKIEFTTDIILKGNQDKFTQMLVNLVENAIKYSNDNGHVTISGHENANEIVFAVDDDGIGIAPNDLDRIAERFYRVDKSRSKKVGGTGLGLSIVKHTAALFNGELVVTSKLGSGSKFSIVIKK
ncbi:MAG: ATP-binding protein [Anaerovoracaceae bacterium]